MTMLRTLLIYSLVLVMLPLGSLAGIVTAGLQADKPIAATLDIPPTPAEKVITKPKRCRTAILPGMTCGGELVSDVPAPQPPVPVQQPAVFYDRTILSDGVTGTDHRDPPRAS